MLSLNLTLRVVATIMLLIIVTQFAYFEAFQIKLFIAANILFVVSVIEFSSAKKKAFICLLLSVIIPLGVFLDFGLGLLCSVPVAVNELTLSASINVTEFVVGIHLQCVLFAKLKCPVE